MKTYIVTLNWNTSEYLKQLLESINTTLPDGEHVWIILDNGSDEDNKATLRETIAGAFKRIAIVSDGTAKMRAAFGLNDLEAFLILSETNLGCIKGHNLCFDVARFLSGDEPHQIVMVDTDVVINEVGWLDTVNKWCECYPEVGIVGMEHSLNEICAPAVWLDTNGNWYIHEPQTMDRKPVEAESVGLGLALIRWPVLASGVRFDELYEMYYKQDDDYCFTVRADLGLEIWAYPVDCVHFGAMSLRTNEYQCGDAEGYQEFDAIKQKNQAKFTVKWRWALGDRRRNMSEQAAWLDHIKGVMADRRGDPEIEKLYGLMPSDPEHPHFGIPIDPKKGIAHDGYD